ncbi:TonB-dependent receptor [Thalassotalea psychrophila]|uniref:TonB-dependent receptor n=1 Tax=Thalassotalea psychrophila TaxID=3065647 RepID=A0ABY9TXI8_9GAMM|nr:TonB-dependent receptor [Colwelliaceae bacterium SQ149]
MQLAKPKLSYLSMAIMLSLGATSNSYAAEEQAEGLNDDVETITVTGIRGSLVRAMDLKKSSDGIVDAISAEDIGKFPDQNVAESLQRISGVAIDRDGGEGQKISVRGLGPEFNAVLVNGRTMASVSGGRAFSFDTLAAELINGAEVNKTQTAKLQDGSIGATVNITTHRPLDLNGFKAVASVKSTYDEMSEESNPTFSGLISNTFADDKFGVLASFSYSDRDTRTDNSLTYGYYGDTTLDSLASGEVLENVYMPQNYDQIVKTENRERTSGTLVFQYQPSDDLVITADALYSEYDVSYREDILAHWFEVGNTVAAELDENRTVVRLTSGNNSATDYLNRLSVTTTETSAFGFNADWQITSDFNLAADISYSKAESNGGNGTTDTVAGFFNGYTFDNSQGGVPTLDFAENLDKNILGANWASIFGDDIEDEISEIRLDAEWVVDQGVLSKVNFGTAFSDRTLSTMPTNTHTDIRNGWGGYGVQLPASLFTDFNADGFLSAESGSPTNDWLIFDSYEYMAFLESEAGYGQLDPADAAAMKDNLDMYNGHTALNVKGQSYEVNEETTAVYFDAYLQGEIGEMPWQIVAGVRYVETTTKSSGYGEALLDMSGPDATGKYVPVLSADIEALSVTSEYDHVLPSINANIEVVEDVFIRTAFSESITRPTLTELSPALSYGEGKIDSLNASGGNPYLEPYESTNFDLSLEWYFDDASYASAAYYTKDIDNFIDGGNYNETVSVPSGDFVYNVSGPENLNSTEIDGLEIAFQHTLTYLPAPFNGFGIMANMTFVDSESDADTAEKPLPLPGLGDSQNLVVFYEQDSFQFRVAYNNRDEFMQSTSNWAGGDPIYVDDYSQVDVSSSYDINDNFTIFVEGINVTNEVTRKRGLLPNHTISIAETGARYSVGVRANF